MLINKDNFIGEAFDGSFTEANPSIDFSRTANLTINGLVTGLSEVLQRRKLVNVWKCMFHGNMVMVVVIILQKVLRLLF